MHVHHYTYMFVLFRKSCYYKIILVVEGVAQKLLKRQSRLGKTVGELFLGEKLHITESITDKDILLYLGLTNDNNPLYIQHDYAALTPYEKPIVPTILLNGIINSAISKHLPGPGSHIWKQDITYLTPVYHYETIEFDLKIIEINEQQNTVLVDVQGYNEKELAIVTGKVTVRPPL